MKLLQIITIAPKPCHSHFCCWLLQIWPILNVYDGNGAYGLCRLGWWFNGAKLYFSWYYKILSIICNTAELSASHRRRATAMSIVACCRFVSTLIFGLKTKLMACVELVGGTTEQSCFFPDLIWYYQWYETLPNCMHYTSAVPQPFLSLIADNLSPTGFLGWKRSLWSVLTWLEVKRIKAVCSLTLYESINDMKHFRTVCITREPCHSHFCCWLLTFWP